MSRAFAITAVLIPAACWYSDCAHAGGPDVELNVQLSAGPEGVAWTDSGRLFASIYDESRIVEISADGVRHVAWVPSEEKKEQGNVVGIEMAPDGGLLVAYRQRSARYETRDLIDPFHPACRDASVTDSGVYEVAIDTGQVRPVVTRADGIAMCFPNDIAVDDENRVYLSDFTYAGIWRVGNGHAELWSTDRKLNWVPGPNGGPPLGVNPIVYDPGSRAILAGTTSPGAVVRVPIDADGRAGPASVLMSGIGPLDGLEVDPRGNIYYSEILRDELWAATNDGSQRSLVARGPADPIDGNASLAYRDGLLCVANIGFPKTNNHQKLRSVVCIRPGRLPWEQEGE